MDHKVLTKISSSMDYNYYFREGFQRGYEDGYYSRYQYGRFADGDYSILDIILNKILGFQDLR